MNDTPELRLRARHRLCQPCSGHGSMAGEPHCYHCWEPWPCEVIMALDALAAESTRLRERAAHGVLTEEQITELGRGDGIYYVCQERAFAPGIADGWPDIIPAPHTKNGRLVKRVAGREGEE